MLFLLAQKAATANAAHANLKLYFTKIIDYIYKKLQI